MADRFIVGLDIGSSKISAALGILEKKRIVDILVETIPFRGIRQGMLFDPIELTAGLSTVLNNLGVKSGLGLKSVYANITGLDINFKHSRSIIPLAERGNKIITPSDIYKARQQAHILGASLEEEILEEFPFSYSIDSQAKIQNPLGLYSHKLELDLYMICIKALSLNNLKRAISQAGYQCKGVFFSALATAEAIWDEHLAKAKNVLICDIGADITELLHYSNGRLRAAKVLALGADRLTQRLSQELKTSWEFAEELKRNHGSVGDYNNIPDDKTVLVKQNHSYKPIRQKDISRILSVEAEAMCQVIKENIVQMTALAEIDLFIISGGVSLLDGFIEFLETVLGIPVRLARIGNQQILPLIPKDNTLCPPKCIPYLTALGVICKAQAVREMVVFDTPLSNRFLTRIVNRVKQVYQEYF